MSVARAFFHFVLRRYRLPALLVASAAVVWALCAVVLVGSAAAALPAGCSQSGSTVTCTLSYTGAAQSWTPPAGVTSVTVDAFGAQGGAGYPAGGGAGGEVSATLAVTPGQAIEVMVGGQGGGLGSGTAGFNGGATGGAAGYTMPGEGGGVGGAGGGGASDVRVGDCAQTLSCGLSARVLVAGGGGGSVFDDEISGFDGAGGGGGNPNGIAGHSAGGGNGGGGGGGTQSMGGAIGAAASGSNCDLDRTPTSGSQGGLGVGGAGGTGGSFEEDGFDGGSGGGGGYYGGGGGGGAACGAPNGASGAGGGGSSFGPDGATFTNAIHDGDGQVTISYTVDQDLALSGVPANITTAATGPTGAVVNYTPPTANDEGGETPSVSCDPASGSTFAVGTTTVTCTATDSDDLNSPVSAQFTVTVTDSDLALQDVPANIVTDASGPSGAVVNYTAPTATDEGGQSPAVNCTPTSGATFAIGTTTVTCTATASDSDDTNSPVSAQFTVTVKKAAWMRNFRDLVVDSRGLGPGQGHSLVHRVRRARSKFLSGDVSGACQTLDGYMLEVNKQTGITITEAQARELIEDAREAQKTIGCARG